MSEISLDFSDIFFLSILKVNDCLFYQHENKSFTKNIVTL